MSSSKEMDLGQPPPSRDDAPKNKAKQKKFPPAADPPPYAPGASVKFPDEKRKEQTPTQPKVSPSRARNARLLWVLMACLVGSIYVIFTKSPLNIKLNLDRTGKPYDSYCNGHGIELRDSSCVCDLGYAGSHCQEIYSFEPAPRERTTVSTPSVLLVTDTFGPLNPYNELASAYENIAYDLGSNSFQVTVLYVGEESGRFSEISNDFASKNIELVQLPSSGLNYGPSPSTTISVDVFRWMLLQQEFDVVHFQASSGAGYYTLLGQHQGLTSWKSKFVVSLDSTSIHTLSQINSGDENFLSTDLESLKLEYMQEKSIEYADTILAPSKSILDDVRALQWAFEESSAVVLPHIPSKSIRRYSDATKTVAKELVFVGSLNIINGLPIFCDAIDHLIEKGAISESHPIRVTFLGSSEYIREMTSVEFLETRSINWKNVKWEVISEPHAVQDVVKYMTRKGSDSIAVLPRLYDSSAFLFQELVGNNVPIIASRLAAMEDVIQTSSSINAMFDVNDFKSLADRLSNAMTDGLMPLEPTANKRKMSWPSLFQEISNAEVVVENDSKENNPLVTVVLVHRNRQKFLEQAIESLYKQTYKNFEVILVDDGSDDLDAIKFLQELAWDWWENRGWKVLREPHRYLGAARNTGIKHAKGSYVLFMDDDDYAKPHQLETLVRVAKQTRADVITAGHDLFDGDNLPPGRRGLIERRVPLGAAKYVGMLENCFGDSNMMVLRSFFVDFGGFSEDFGVGFEDYEFLAKIVLRGHHLEVIPESLHWYRRHRDAMSFNTDRKANQIRFLRAYMEEHQNAPHRQRALLEYTKTKFFARDAASLGAYEKENLNFTMTATGTDPNPTQHPCGPALIIDDFTNSSVSHSPPNRLGLETNWLKMTDSRIADGKLFLTPTSFDESYYYTILSKGCFDAKPFNALEIVVGEQTPVNSSFAVVLNSPKDCANDTVVDVRSLRTSQYATFNGTRQVLRIQLSDFELDTCKLHGLILEDFSPSDGKSTFVIDSIRFYSECIPYPTEVYHVRPTATGTLPKETDAYGGVALLSMIPPAANISSDMTFSLNGTGFQNYGVHLYCVVDGVKTGIQPTVLSPTSALCRLKDVDILGGHTLTLNVNGTVLPYSRPFYVYPGDAEVTTCQAKGYVQSTIDVRVDGINLIDTDYVTCVIEGPDIARPRLVRAVPAWSHYDPYSNPPREQQQDGSNTSPSEKDFPYNFPDGFPKELFDKYFPTDGDFPKDLFPSGFNPGYLPPGADVSAFIASEMHQTLPAVKEYLSQLAEKTGGDYDYLSMIAQHTQGDFLSRVAQITGKYTLPTNTDQWPNPTEIVQSLSSLMQDTSKVSSADLPKITQAIDDIIKQGQDYFSGHHKRALVPGTEIIKAHSWTCPVVNVTTGGLYTVRLSLDGGIRTVPGHVNTWVYDHAPSVIKSGFEDSGASVIVKFDRDIRILGDDAFDYSQEVDCSIIFDLEKEGNIKLGSLNETTCSINENALQIALSFDSTLKPGDQLRFTEKTIFSKANPFVSEGWLGSVVFTVEGPSVIPKPVVVVYAPQIVGQCDTALVSVGESYNDGGRPLTFYWSTGEIMNEDFVNELKKVNKTTNTSITFGKDVLDGGATYTITFSAENFLGGKSESVSVTFTKSADPIPQIQIFGSDIQTVVSTDDYFIRTDTIQTNCGDYDPENEEFVYKWSFDDINVFPIEAKELTASTLYIKRHSLSKNSGNNKVYKLRVEVSTKSRPEAVGFDTVEIHGLVPPASFAIGNGDVSIGVGSELLVYAYFYDASSTADPVVTWACVMVDGINETPCTISGGGALLLDQLLDPKKLQFTVGKNNLLPSKQYKFTATLTGTHGRDDISDDILVTTVANPVPVVAAKVILPTYNAKRILAENVLNVFAEVQEGTYDNYKALTFAWNSIPGSKQVSGNTVKLSTIPMDSIKVTYIRDQLIIRGNTLLPGNTYRFQVVVTDPNGASGSSFVDISVAKLPTVGSVIPSSFEGEALSDSFEITASQWTVDPASDMPLSYQFDVFTSGDLTRLPAFTFPFQTSPKIKTFLPTPSTGDSIWIVVTGRSKIGASSTKAISIKVTKVERSVTQMKAVFDTAAKDAIKRGDTGAYLRIATGVVNDLIAKLQSLLSKRLRVRNDDTASMAETLNGVLDGVLTNVVTPSPVTGATLELHACTLQTLFSVPEYVNSTNAAAVLQMIKLRVTELQGAQNTVPDFRLTLRAKQCISRTVGSLAEIYAQHQPPSNTIRQTILDINTLVNSLYMRDMACGAPTQNFVSGSTNEYLAKGTLSSFTLSANDAPLVTFPENIPATSGDNPVNCFCMQETVQDAGLYSFVGKEVAGLGTVQIASTASNLRLRDCSSVQRSVPKNTADVLAISGLENPIQMVMKLTPTAKALFDAGKHDVKCVYYDVSNPTTPILSVEGITTGYASGDEYTCETSHLSTLMLVLSAKEETPTSTSDGSTGTATSTSGATSTSAATTTTTGTPSDGTDSTESGGIGTGAIAGIVIGVCGGAAIAGGAAYFIMKKK